MMILRQAIMRTFLIVQSGPEKIAQSLMHRHFATVCIRITLFHQNAQKKINVEELSYRLRSGLLATIFYTVRA